MRNDNESYFNMFQPSCSCVHAFISLVAVEAYKRITKFELEKVLQTHETVSQSNSTMFAHALELKTRVWVTNHIGRNLRCNTQGSWRKLQCNV